MKRPLEPIQSVPLFAEMREELIRVLSGLLDEDWSKPTACAGWTVKDVALHLLADTLGYVSRNRDGDGIYFDTLDWDELIALINQHNDVWVRATRRLSRKLIISLLRLSGDQMNEYLCALPPDDDTTHRVSWAGNQPLPRWLEVARELTEFWMHHQHICEAVGITSLKTRRFIHPVLSAFVYALPSTYAAVQAASDTVVQLVVTGEGAGEWVVIREAQGWVLYAETDLPLTSRVIMSDDLAWRLFTKGITAEQARAGATVDGDQSLGEVLFSTVAILA